MITHYQLTQINITGYRRLFSIDMKMRPLMVMIGANGVGKTSVLDVFGLLTSAAQGKLQQILSKFGGIDDILTADETEKVSFKVSMACSSSKLDYSLTLNKKGMSYEIGSETLVQENFDSHKSLKYIDADRSDIRYFHADGNKLVRPTWEHSPFETWLPT
jgi:predicted ATPase